MGLFESQDRFKEDIKKYADSEITAPELGLRLLGETGGLFGEGLSTYTDYLMPDFISDPVMDYIGNSSVAKSLSKWADENPRLSRNINSGIQATGILPLNYVRPNNMLRLSESMPNDLPDFYKGPMGQIKEGVRAFTEGNINRAGDLINPRSQAFMREMDTSPYIQDVAKKAYARAEVLKDKVDNYTGNRNGDEFKALDTEYKKQLKIVMGQAGQNYLLNKQYGKYNELLSKLTGDFNMGTGPLSPTTLKEFVPELPQRDLDSVFRAITQQQKTKNGIFVNRVAVGSAAGDLGAALSRFKGGNKGVVESVKDYFSGKPVGKATQREMTHTNIGKVFSDRPVNSGFSSYNDLIDSLSSGKSLGKLEKGYLSKNPKLAEVLDSGVLSSVTDKDKVLSVLKANGVKPSATLNKIIDKGFSRRGTKPFADNAELIDALEKKGISVYNKPKALKGDPVLVVDSTRSSALDLGGVNIIQAVYPDGRKVSFINDKNDMLGMTPAGAKDIVSVAVIEHQLAGKDKLLGKRERPSAPKVATEQPFASTLGTNYQKQVTQDLLDYEPTITLRDRANAAKNVALFGGMSANMLNGVPQDEQTK
jgi:hypothetical protein